MAIPPIKNRKGENQIGNHSNFSILIGTILEYNGKTNFISSRLNVGFPLFSLIARAVQLGARDAQRDVYLCAVAFSQRFDRAMREAKVQYCFALLGNKSSKGRGPLFPFFFTATTNKAKIQCENRRVCFEKVQSPPFAPFL